MTRMRASESGGSPREGGRARTLRFVALALVAIALLTGVAALVLYGRGGGPLPGWLSFLGPERTDLLAASGPAETTLRTLRLAGIERATVGAESGTVVVRLELPAAQTSTDVTAAWQIAIGALAGAYPDEKRYVVQVFGADAQPLLEFGWARDAVFSEGRLRAADDLKAGASVRLLSETGGAK